jgi:lipoprotein
MKKLSIRSLLIVVLALVLVFSLVACGDKDKGGNNGGNNTPPTPPDTTANVKNYFNTLWEKSTGIGGEKIGETDDLKVSLGLTVALDFADSNGSVKDSIDLGILLDVVLDRSSGTDKSTNTAIKAKFYDPTSGENWFSAYYFFNDVDNIYIDYAGQHVQIPFSYLNDTYNKNFYNFVFNDKVIKDKVDDKGQVTKEGKTIAQIITALTENMGSSWDLNVLIGDVLKVFDIDIKSAKDTISGVLEMIGIKADDAFDAQGNINIKNILTNDTVAEFFVNDETTTTTENGVTTYVTKLAPSVLDMLSMIGGSLPESLKGLLDVIDGLDLALEFTTKNDAIDSFTIRAGLPAIEGENANVVDVHPVVAITITDLDFAKASKGEIEKSMATEKNNYKNDVVLDAEVAIDLKGITLNALAFDKEGYARFSKVNTAIDGGLDNIVLDGTLALTLNGKLDLKNKENNGTVAKAALTYKGVNIVEASFVNGTLAVKVNQEAKIGDVKILDTLVRLFGDYAYSFVKTTFFKGNAEDAALKAFATKFFGCDIEAELTKDPQERVVPLNESFQGAVWNGIDVPQLVQGLIKQVLNKLFPPKTDGNAGTAVATDPIITKVADTVVAALPLIKSTKGKLVVATNDNKAFKGNYATVGNAVTTIGKIWWVKDAKPFTETLITNDKDGWLPVFANALKVAGTTYGDKADAEKVKTFLNEMFACTAEVTLDISEANGFELGVKADVNASAGVAVSVKLGAKAYDATQYTNLAPDVETDGWFVYTFAA